MSDSNATICAQCDRPIDGPDQKFCPSCGQPTPAHRIDWEFLSHELQHSVFHVDKGILFTIKHLITRPGHMIREYLQGRRGGHFKPVLMIMILGAVVTLLSKYVLGVGVFDGMVDINQPSAEEAKAASEVVNVVGLADALKAVGQWTSDHFGLVTLFLVPFEALAFKLAFRRYRHLNYPEWLVITTFLTAQVFLIHIVAIFVKKWFPDSSNIFTMLGFVANVLTLVQLFKGEQRWKIALRSAWGLALFFILTTLLMAAGALLLIYRYST